MSMNKYDRMLHILNLLRTRKNMNADKLAEECNVTERTIYRDIFTLSDMNIPIYFENGYKLASDNFLPPLNFSFEEYQLLKLTLESSPLIKTNKYQVVYNSLKAKIENCLSEQVLKEKKYSPQATHIDIPDNNQDEHTLSFYEQVEKAVTSLTTISLTYESIKSGRTERRIDPYFIIFRGRAFYFVGFCHLKNEMRTFRMDRIIELNLTNDIFIKKGNISPENYFDGSWSVFSGEPIDVIVQFRGNAAKVIQSSTHHKNEQIEVINENMIRYSVTTNGIEEIQRWILGFGDEAEVVAPIELKENLFRVGCFLKSRYMTE